MSIAVLRFEQAHSDAPEHHISRSLAEKFLAFRYHGKRSTIRLQPRLIKIQCQVPFGVLKALVRALEREEQASCERVKPYIGPMPPVEVECLHFKPPANFEQQKPHFIRVRI